MPGENVRHTRMRFLLSLIAAIASASIPAFARPQPEPPVGVDFSGRWVLIDPTPTGFDQPERIVVEQHVRRANAYGEPITPFYSALIVRREFGGNTTTETHQIGVEGGVIRGSFATCPPDCNVEYSATWDGMALLLRSREVRSGSDSVYREHTERWSLEGAALVIGVVEQRTGEPRTMTTLRFRRNERP